LEKRRGWRKEGNGEKRGMEKSSRRRKEEAGEGKIREEKAKVTKITWAWGRCFFINTLKNLGKTKIDAAMGLSALFLLYLIRWFCGFMTGKQPNRK
jgi:hypothetical protein